MRDIRIRLRFRKNRIRIQIVVVYVLLVCPQTPPSVTHRYWTMLSTVTQKCAYEDSNSWNKHLPHRKLVRGDKAIHCKIKLSLANENNRNRIFTYGESSYRVASKPEVYIYSLWNQILCLTFYWLVSLFQYLLTSY